jgi:hypothetical protein
MTDRESKKFPQRTLGYHLKSLREKENESVPDVSGAVEIDAELLIEFEDDQKLPSEDILLLLISHFGLKNEEAMNLWRLAGYDNLTDINQNNFTEGYNQQAAVFILPIDSRVIYTDMVQTEINDSGIIINFQQTNTQQNQPLTVAKVGMSHDQAERVINELQKTMKKKPKRQLRRNNKTDDNKKSTDKNKWHGSQDS